MSVEINVGRAAGDVAGLMAAYWKSYARLLS